MNPASFTGANATRFHLFVLISVVFSFSGCQDSPTNQLPPDGTSWSARMVPFKLTSANNIIVQGVLNDTDTLDLMFHTANSGISVIASATPGLSSLKFDTSSVQAESWGAGGESRYSLDNSLGIAAFEMDSLVVFECQRSGPESDGKIGPDLFGDGHMQILFDKNRIIFWDDLPESLINQRPIPLRVEDDFLFVTLELEIEGERLEREVLIHSGYSGALLIDDEFAAKHQLGEKLEIIDEAELQDSYGNVIKTKKAVMPALHLGDATLENVPVSFFDGAIGRQKMSVIGGDLLKRFNMIIDSANETIYLTPNDLYNSEFSE